MAKLPPAQQLKGRTLGRILIKMGILTRDKVHECLKIQQQRGKGMKIGEILMEMGLIKEKELRVALAGQREVIAVAGNRRTGVHRNGA